MSLKIIKTSEISGDLKSLSTNLKISIARSNKTGSFCLQALHPDPPLLPSYHFDFFVGEMSFIHSNILKKGLFKFFHSFQRF